jgi:hypothetical protein
MELENYTNYILYKDGKVWSKKTNRFLKSWVSKNGYVKVCLSQLKDKQLTKQFYIHRLLAKYYIPNDDKEKKYIDHIDRNKTNNELTNLRWVTHSENMCNVNIRKHNNTGEQYIGYEEKYDRYRFRKTTNKKTFQKIFKTKEDAIKFRDEYLISVV